MLVIRAHQVARLSLAWMVDPLAASQRPPWDSCPAEGAPFLAFWHQTCYRPGSSLACLNLSGTLTAEADAILRLQRIPVWYLPDIKPVTLGI